MSSYTEAHRKYFLTHKQEIYDKYREQKREYNRAWYQRNKKRAQVLNEAARRVRRSQEIRDAFHNSVQDVFQDTNKKVTISRT